MRPRGRHPGGTGVYELKDPGFSARQRSDLLNLARSWELAQLDETAFWSGICHVVANYNAAKKVGDESSAGAMRRNLRTSVKHAKKLLDHLRTLDGNSVQHANRRSPAHDIRGDAQTLLTTLEHALEDVIALYSPSGRRPPDELLQLVVNLAELMRDCSSMKVGEECYIGPFDSLVEAVFMLVGLDHSKAFGWIDKALSQDWYIEYAPGVRVFVPEAKSRKK